VLEQRCQLYRIICDSTFLHGLKHVEIMPDDKAALAPKSAAKKKVPAKKSSDSGQDSDPRDLDAAQVIVRPVNVNDLLKLQSALQPINDVV
jgi:hypothetical protein